MKTAFIIPFLLIIAGHCSCQIDIKPAKDSIYTFVEQNPQFPGGNAELLRFLESNFHYPETQKEDEISGKVVLRFIVDTDGSVIKPAIVRSCGLQIDKELIRVLSLLPKFKPAYQDGNAVKYSFYLQINDFFGR